MRFMLLMAALAVFAACSPTTDVTRTSTEQVAGRRWYEVVETRPAGDFLRVTLKMSSLAAARTVAEDVVVRMRAPYNRIEVDVFVLDDRTQGSPAAVLKWSTRGGFSFSEVAKDSRGS